MSKKSLCENTKNSSKTSGSLPPKVAVKKAKGVVREYLGKKK